MEKQFLGAAQVQRHSLKSSESVPDIFLLNFYNDSNFFQYQIIIFSLIFKLYVKYLLNYTNSNEILSKLRYIKISDNSKDAHPSGFLTCYDNW